jgi:hypothetical protein
VSKRQQPFIHPFTFFLVSDVQLAYENAYQGRTSDSIKALHLLTLSLDQKGQEALKKEVEEMETILDGNKRLDRATFRRLFAEVLRELHKEGYFIMAKMTPPTKTTTMRDLELEMDHARYATH